VIAPPAARRSRQSLGRAAGGSGRRLHNRPLGRDPGGGFFPVLMWAAPPCGAASLLPQAHGQRLRGAKGRFARGVRFRIGRRRPDLRSLRSAGAGGSGRSGAVRVSGTTSAWVGVGRGARGWGDDGDRLGLPLRHSPRARRSFPATARCFRRAPSLASTGRAPERSRFCKKPAIVLSRASALKLPV